MSPATYDGLDEDGLSALTRSREGVHIHGSVPSVMDLAHEAAESGAERSLWVIADEQTAGRGRAGRAWHSPPGAGIWMAMILQPKRAPEGGTLAIRAGLAVREALAAARPPLAIRLKWPNDLVVAGRKLGGILCEARWTGNTLGWIIAGIGINVRGPLPPEVAATAITATDVDPAITRLSILESLVPRLWPIDQGGPVLVKAERQQYLDALWMPPGSAEVAGLDPDGALLVRQADGTITRRTEAS